MVFHWGFCFYCWWYERCCMSNSLVSNVIDLPLMSRSLHLDLIALLLLDKSLEGAGQCRWTKQCDDGEVTPGNLTPFKGECSLVSQGLLLEIYFPVPSKFHSLQGLCWIFFLFWMLVAGCNGGKKSNLLEVQKASTTSYTKEQLLCHLIYCENLD